ncbi:Holliday junction branch migration protein RuvA [Priestia flexa]|uniref:Holliday junction branch migration complex subunit RuvA n=2 Tax=Priestia TaxID=2800373 RepID=A0A0V8JN99_9BACI|nr:MULTISPECIES: Holliday junction branch migration protein RuvA [Bacillaceae]AQX53628.1 Holliday junction DNA helicase RuvA [Priestia flexa]KSU88530.1 Holliday junction ATP-dependent DNA helicase RuvA [Priestia veravalensis]KZB92758.1 Holliday junction DNA helicase RuvA [Bacillus sp. VT 712]MBN8250540.1 Holliday junction branch migration protein RuvA [Priestia flexa]MBN8432638.1 Holliday junction branch migration protein RuvA [Priestia flexa]
MIDYIRGVITYINPEYVVIENQGMGYQVFTPNPYVFSVDNEERVIYTYQYVREDILALYGFNSREQKELFMKLISVSGIGPKGALAILASGNPSQVVQAIEEENEKFLVKFPGVGKKTARQMILDLKGKLHDIVPDAVPSLFADMDEQEVKSQSSEALDEAIEALKVLGYAEREINKVVPALMQQSMTTDQYIKEALKRLLK